MIGTGILRWEKCAISWSARPAQLAMQRWMRNVSAKPRVIRRPVLTPLRSMKALVAAVVPCAKYSRLMMSSLRGIPICCGRAAERVQHALRSIARRGRRFHDGHVAIVRKHDEVGEGAADVGADVVAHPCSKDARIPRRFARRMLSRGPGGSFSPSDVSSLARSEAHTAVGSQYISLLYFYYYDRRRVRTALVQAENLVASVNISEARLR